MGRLIIDIKQMKQEIDIRANLIHFIEIREEEMKKTKAALFEAEQAGQSTKELSWLYDQQSDVLCHLKELLQKDSFCDSPTE